MRNSIGDLIGNFFMGAGISLVITLLVLGRNVITFQRPLVSQFADLKLTGDFTRELLAISFAGGLIWAVLRAISTKRPRT